MINRQIALTCFLGAFVAGNIHAQQSTSEAAVEVIQIFGDQAALETATGSAYVLSSEDLEQFEYDDIHRILRSIPGVYIREEDGFGLRPNIGLRGATTERSSKVALMEDSILLAPAPYAAPAAYFFPMMTRMQKVEVFKGPSAIRYGPNTVGGAINLISSDIDADGTGEIDLAVGELGYRKAHGKISHSLYGFDAMVEGVHIGSDGFKELDSGGDTGFQKNEVIAKVAYEIDNAENYQRWEFKYGYADEVSDETYLGLTDADFVANPNRRYIASELDELDWEHFQYSLSHFIELSNDTYVFSQLYRRDFERDWDRVNRLVSNRSLASILSSPNTGINTLFMQVIRGERDSLVRDETLLQTLNDRKYYSQGFQSKIVHEIAFKDVDLTIDAGVRIHQDQVERLHRDRGFFVRSGALVRTQQPDVITTRNKDKVTAIAGYIETHWQWQDLTATVGVRVEDIDGDATDFLASSELSTSDTVVLPGFGIFYQLNKQFGILAGVNKGFVPNSPGQQSDIEPEESWNYEFGFRSSYFDWHTSVVGFFNDYSNLKGTCTFSSGCLQTLDQEFNGGEVDVLGVEFSTRRTFDIGSLKLPVSLVYTATDTEFQTDFRSDFSQWGTVSAGDELPYIPENQLTLSVGVEGNNWRTEVSYKYVDEMLEAAGANTELSGVYTDTVNQFDISAWYQWSKALETYFKVDNLTDQQDIVSRRPFGARPSKPRHISIGMKYQF